MKKILLSIFATTLAFGFGAGAQAKNTAMSTADLLSYCKGKDSDIVTCEIYGQAVYDTYLVYSNHRKAPKFICVNQPAPTRKAVIQEYVAWADANPKYAQDAAADSILRFLGGRFPCPKPVK
jgi:hypothetical protein